MSVASVLHRLYDHAAHHVRSPDPLAVNANTGAAIIWTHLPFYPLLAWWLAGPPVWPTLVVFLSWPLFFAVPFVSRRHPTMSRTLFVIVGAVNTLICVKSLGVASGVGWFLLPCLLIAATFFRLREWKLSGALTLFCGLCVPLTEKLGAPLHAYSTQQSRELASLNHWCVGCFVAYLAVVAARSQWKAREAV